MKHIKLRQGDTLRRRILLTYIGTKNPLDLTGYTAKSQFRAYPGGDLIAEATMQVDAGTGRIIAEYSAEQTAAIEPGEYGYDIRVQSETDRRTLYSELVTVVKPYTE
jgi:hypothetical protein